MSDTTDTQAIDRAVAELRVGRVHKCPIGAIHEYVAGNIEDGFYDYSPSTNPAQAWDLMMEMAKYREPELGFNDDGWSFGVYDKRKGEWTHGEVIRSQTPQVAICLCYIAFKKEQAQ